MTGAGVTSCKSCGAPITWAVTKNQKRIPLDAEPTDAGNVELLHTSAAAPPFARVRATGGRTLTDGEDLVLYMPHHATCPNWGKR